MYCLIFQQGDYLDVLGKLKYLNSYYLEIHRGVFMWLALLTDTQHQNEGIVTHHQFLMEQAGRARIITRLKRASRAKLASKESRQSHARICFPKFGSKWAGQTSCVTKIEIILRWFNRQNEKSIFLVNARGIPNTLQLVHSYVKNPFVYHHYHQSTQ